MEDKVFKYAIVISLILHGILFWRLYAEKGAEILMKKKPELNYRITPAKPKPVDVPQYVDKVKSLESSPLAAKVASDVPVPDVASFQEAPGIQDNFKMYERKPDKLKGMKVTKEVTVPMLKSEKINTPSYVTYYQIVRDRIRERAYNNYTKLSVGEVYLTFIIRSDGTLNGLQILEDRTEGNQFLREVGIRSVQEAGPFPVFPKDLNYPELTFNVQISFQYHEESQ